MAETRRRFDWEFREGAVRIVRETGTSIAQVARDLGISDGTLANWVKKDREARGEAAAGGLSEDERAELARLRRGEAEPGGGGGGLPRAGGGGGTGGRPRSGGWGVIPSRVRWWGGSRKRRAGERGRRHRFPEDRTRRAARDRLPSPGGLAILVLPVA